MKNLKKVLSLVVVFVMLFSLAIPAFAAETGTTTYTITINNTAEGHEYAAYQIFDGELKDGKLAKITWGSGVSLEGDAKLTVTVGDEPIELDAAGWAEKLSTEKDDSALLKAFADAVSEKLTTPAGTSTEDAGPYTITGLADGYYLVKDTKAVSGQDSWTRYILKVAGADVSVAPKSSTPSLEKEVLDNNDSDSNDPTNGWGETADHDIGDSVSFRLIGTLPSTYADYARYRYVFHDKLSDGLDFDGEESVSVKVVTGDDPYAETDIELDFVVDEEPEDGCSFHVVFKNLKLYEDLTADHKIIVYYTATLNGEAVIGNDGNPNDAKLQFSNDPNYKGKGKPEDDEPDEPTGDTPWDTVVVFTYQLDVTKVDEEGDPLDGAEFTLYKWVEYVEGQLPELPAGWVSAAGDDNAPEAKNDNGEWVKVGTKISPENGEFSFKGLDDGDYVLVETKAPDGYNKAANIEFTISAEDDGEKLTEVDFGNDQIANGEDGASGKTGVGTTEVENKTGTQLPSTGGIGTVILCVVGGLLVVMTGVLLVSKRRMKGLV